MENTTYLKVDTGRLAVVSCQPTTGIYSVYQRGSSVILQSFLKSLDEAKTWCVLNGWELPSPSVAPVLAALVAACNEALGERQNYSGLSDDSEPVLSAATRKKLREAIELARSINPKCLTSE